MCSQCNKFISLASKLGLRSGKTSTIFMSHQDQWWTRQPKQNAAKMENDKSCCGMQYIDQFPSAVVAHMRAKQESQPICKAISRRMLRFQLVQLARLTARLTVNQHTDNSHWNVCYCWVFGRSEDCWWTKLWFDLRLASDWTAVERHGRLVDCLRCAHRQKTMNRWNDTLYAYDYYYYTLLSM